MKVKKVLSLALALVMVFTMIPAQLIFSSANKSGWETAEIGDIAELRTYVSISGETAYADFDDADFDGFVDVALQLKIDPTKYDALKTKLNDDGSIDGRFITNIGQIVAIDPTYFSFVDAYGDDSDATVRTKASSASNSYECKGTDYVAFLGQKVTVLRSKDSNKTKSVTYGNNLSAISYNPDINTFYALLQVLELPPGYVLANPGEYNTFLHLYLKLKDGVKPSDVPANAIRLVSESELGEGGTCLAVSSFIEENYISTPIEPNRFVPNASVAFSDDFAPAAPTQYTVKYQYEDGSQFKADDTVDEGTAITLPEISPKAADDTYTYAVDGWYNGDNKVTGDQTITADTTFTAKYTKTYKDYTIDFVDEAGAKFVETQTLHWGDNVTVPTNTGREGFTFLGWYLAEGTDPVTPSATVDGSKTYIAKYEAVTPDQYTIKFQYEDGTAVADDQVLNSGATVVFPTPTKEDTAEYKYTFDGWYLDQTKVDDTSAVTATADATYVAKFNETKQKYTVTFKNGYDNTTIGTPQEVEYGSLPTYPEVSDYDDELYIYEFKGWDKALAPVTGDDVYVAQIERKDKPADYSSVTAAKAEANEILSSPEYAAKYTSQSREKLEKALRDVVENLPKTRQDEVDAMATAIRDALNLEIQKYTITYTQHSGEPVTKDFDYGTPAIQVESNAPYVSDYFEEGYNYSFEKWTPDFEVVTGAKTYNAKYNDGVPVQYEVKFVNWNGVELQKGNVAYGTVPEYTGAIPTRDNDAENSYTFNGWDKAITAVTGDVTYTAQFAPTPLTPDVTYTVTFQTENGDNIEVFTGKHLGDTITAPTAPDKEATAEFTYTFAGWEPAFDGTVTGNVTYKATYQPTKKSYTVTFKNGDKILQADPVEYGTVPTYNGETPEKEATAEFTYTFDGWDVTPVAVTGEAVYNAKFASTKNKYEIKFVNENGTVLQNEQVEYGTVPVYTGTEVPKKDSTAQYYYTFKGWDTEPVAVTGPATYTATYREDIKSYMVTFKNGDVNLYHSMFNYGETPVYNGETPIKPEDNTYTYTFDGWEPEIAAVTGEATYQAKFKPVYKDYTITFVDYNDRVIDTQTYHYGDEITPPEDPERADDNVYTYDFDAWTPAVPDTVTENATFKATYESTYIDYVISFYDGDGKEIAVQTLHFGDPIVPPTTATKTEDETYTYTFTGWDPQVPATVSEGELGVYNATFEPVYKNYTIKFMVDGSVYNDQTLHYGDVIVVPTDPSKDATAEFTYTFAGWSPAVAATVTGDAEYAATFTAEKNRYDVTVVTKDTDGNDLTATTSVEYGETPVLPEPATNFVVGTTKYTFIGWDKTAAPVTGPVTYTAQYSTSTVTNPVYTVNFKYADTAEQAESKQFADHTQSIEQNDMPNVPTPANFETATMKYEFSGWDKDVVAATGDAVYTAQYTETPILQKFEINFRYADTVEQAVEDGELADHPQTVNEGDMPEIPTPKDFVDGNTTYHFVGWEPAEITAATGDATYTAVYQAVTKFVPDLSEFEELVARYNQMVKTGLYNKADLRAVKALIDDIYDRIDNETFENQDEVDAIMLNLRTTEDAVRKIEKSSRTEEEETTEERTVIRRTSPRTGDNATLVVMSVILVSSIGLAVISLKKKRENI